MTKTTFIANPELSWVFDQDYTNKGVKKITDEEFEKIFKIKEAKIPKVGEVIPSIFKGKLAGMNIFSVDGFKDSIYVESRISEEKYLTDSNIGDVIDVLITDIDQNQFFIKGSICELYESRAHQNLMNIEEGQSVTALIKSVNPAGYDVNLYHGGVTLPAFMPNTLAGINKLYDVNSIVGQKIEVMIESYSQQEGTYIVSRRKYLQTLIPAAIKSLKQGEVYDGNVTGTTQFGVFVEFNECLTGMIHKANIDPDWQDRLVDIKPGTPIQFYVKEIIKDKIILTQILRETLWDNIKNGQTLDGQVKDVKPFGTLVKLDDETIGLIHTSEMEKLGKKFTSGQEIKVKVLSVDRMSRKIFLTLSN
jgi:small subunit ribosomal protein S1